MNNIWYNDIFIIPIDLFYFKINKTNIHNYNEILTSVHEKKNFTEFLTSNWKKHINNYQKHKLSGYKKVIGKLINQKKN